MNNIIYRITLVFGHVLQMLYMTLIPYLLIYSISPNYMKHGEPQTDHLLRRAEIPQNARSPPKIKGKSLNLRRQKNSDYGIFWEKMDEMFYICFTSETPKNQTCKTFNETWTKNIIKYTHAHIRAHIYKDDNNKNYV